jgi:hypothetical protein
MKDNWIPPKEDWMDDEGYAIFNKECERLLPDGPAAFAEYVHKLMPNADWSPVAKALDMLEDSMTARKRHANKKMMKFIFGKRN